MDEMFESRNPGTAKLMDVEINRALRERGVSVTSPVKSAVRQRLQLISGYSDIALRVLDGNGTLRTIPDYLNELEADPQFAPYFTHLRLPQISPSDEERMRENFSRIARGEVRVVDDPEP